MDLSGKVVLITGAGSGIGAATAKMMAASGAQVVITGIPTLGIQAVYEEISALGHSALAIPTDVTVPSQIKDAISKTVEAFGQLDIVIPNAGIQLHDSDVNLHALPDAVWDQTHAVNYRGVYLTAKYGLAQFMSQGKGGVIVIVASVTALSGMSANPAYMTGKHGLLGLNRYIAVHYGQYGIRCNAVCPGALEQTPNHDIHPDPSGRFDRLTTRIPLGRLGRPEDIAPFITFLASPAAAYANGANCVVDGGLTVT
ncbi:MAG: SDR family NAD(P)-dependent oxidoreductase [Chloroflexota bacterium]